jgi:nitronate monooxygenase
LALAVMDGGGLGSLPAAMLAPEALAAQMQALADGAHGRPWAVNFFCHTPPAHEPAREAAWLNHLAPHYAAWGVSAPALPLSAARQPFSAESAALVEAFRPPVVSFHFGLPPAALLARVKATGAVVMSSATTVEEARWLQAHGADVVIAQGLEAGGHRGHFLSDDLSLQRNTLALLPQVLAAVELPVVAAGCIADAAGVAAVLALGAVAAQIGTAYLLCPEATTSALHRQALQSPAAQQTALTNRFTGRPARGIVNAFMQDEPMSTLAPDFPLATAALAPLRAAAEAQGRSDFTPLWAGQNAALLSAGEALSATTLTQRLNPL